MTLDDLNEKTKTLVISNPKKFASVMMSACVQKMNQAKSNESIANYLTSCANMLLLCAQVLLSVNEENKVVDFHKK